MGEEVNKKEVKVEQEEFEKNLLEYKLEGYVDQEDLNHPMSFSKDDWVKWIDENLVHFISKPINSNASNACVRYNPHNKNAPRLPHLSVRSLLLNNEMVPLDSFGGSHASKFFSELVTTIGINIYTSEEERDFERQKMKNWRYKMAVLKEYKKLGIEIPKSVSIPTRPSKKIRSKNIPVEFKVEEGKEYRLEIHNHVSKIDKEFGTDTVSPRLRQILIPTGLYEKSSNEDYVCMTPLVSAGLSWAIKNIIISRQLKFKENSQENEFKRIKTLSEVGIGGANAQNVSGYANALNQIMLFVDLPKSDAKLKKAFSVAYNGFNLELNYVIMLELFKKLQASRSSGLTMSKSIDSISLELKKLVEKINEDARKYLDAVEEHQDVLIEKMTWESLQDFDDSLTPVDAFWLGIEDSPVFKKDIAEDLVEKIVKFPIKNDKETGQRIYIEFSKEEKSIMRNMLIGSVL